MHPDLFGTEDVIVDLTNALASITSAEILYRTGERGRANYLFELNLDLFQTLHRTRGAPYGILDVQIHIARGDREKAIAGLREAYDIDSSDARRDALADAYLAIGKKRAAESLRAEER